MLRSWRPVRRWRQSRLVTSSYNKYIACEPYYINRDWSTSLEAEPECMNVFWLGTTCTEGPIGRQPGLVAALGVFPTLPGPDIVEPEAAAEFDAETEYCFTLFAEVKGEDL